jgi:hypothetical protein
MFFVRHKSCTYQLQSVALGRLARALVSRKGVPACQAAHHTESGNMHGIMAKETGEKWPPPIGKLVSCLSVSIIKGLSGIQHHSRERVHVLAADASRGKLGEKKDK